jgi:hypothetical protein
LLCYCYCVQVATLWLIDCLLTDCLHSTCINCLNTDWLLIYCLFTDWLLIYCLHINWLVAVCWSDSRSEDHWLARQAVLRRRTVLKQWEHGDPVSDIFLTFFFLLPFPFITDSLLVVNGCAWKWWRWWCWE